LVFAIWFSLLIWQSEEADRPDINPNGARDGGLSAQSL